MVEAKTRKKITHNDDNWALLAMAVALIMMITGHCCEGGEHIRSLFFSVYVPLIFFLFGVQTKAKNRDEDNLRNVGFEILNDGKRFLLPLLVVSPIPQIIYLFGNTATKEAILREIYLWIDSIYAMTGISYAGHRAIGLIWGVFSLFAVSVLWRIVNMKLGTTKTLIISLLPLIIAFLLSNNGIWLPLSIDTSMVDFFFFSAGAFFYKEKEFFRKFRYVYMAFGIVLWGLFLYKGMFIEIASRSYSSFFVFLEALSGIAFIVGISYEISVHFPKVSSILRPLGLFPLTIIFTHHLDGYFSLWVGREYLWSKALLRAFVVYIFAFAFLLVWDALNLLEGEGKEFISSLEKHTIYNNTYKKSTRYFCTYSIAFFITFCWTILFWYLREGKSFIASYDSLDQHYIGFIYVGQCLRSFFHVLLSEHKISFAMWDISIGYGSDILSTLPVYFYDPFYWISAIVPIEKSELVFGIIIVIKIYLCGISFSLLSISRGNSYKATLCGALAYAFAGSVYVGLLQTIFLSAMYLYPLVIMGVDHLWEKRRCEIYVLSLALTFFTYFYFAYMICLLVFGYCIIRFLTGPQNQKNFQYFIKMSIRFIWFSALSLGISMIAVFPSVIGLIGAGRLSVKYYLPLLYEIDRYIGFISCLFDYQWVGMDCYIGISAIAAPCLILLFLKKGCFIRQRIIVVVLTIGILFPIFGYIFNGFGYVTNRWSFAYSLCLAYTITLALPEFKGFFETKKTKIIGIAIGYCIFVELLNRGESKELHVIMICVLICCIFAAVSSYLTEQAYWRLAVLIVMVTVFFPGKFFFSSQYGDWVSMHMNRGDAIKSIINSSALPILSENQRNNTDRYDQYGVRKVNNASWFYGISGINFYVSLYNNNVDIFHNHLGMLTSPWAYGYNGLNYRSELEALMGVSHYIVEKDNKCWLPYGYEVLEAEGEIDSLVYQSYAPSTNVSLMHLFDKTISQDAYNSLEPYERQQVLMQSVVIEEGKSDISELTFENNEVEYSIINSEGIDTFDNSIFAEYPGAYMILDFSEVTDSEVYAWFNNIHYEYGNEGQYRIVVRGMYDDSEVEGVWAGYNGLNNKYHMYGGKVDWLLNLGHSDKKVNRIKVIFEKEGTYTLDSLKVYARPHKSISENQESLNSVGDGIEIGTNSISASVSTDTDKILLVSIPYSTGWTAYVDGVKTEILKADDAFIALPVSAGNHFIKMTYFTPGLKIGAIVSAISVIILMVTKKKRND